MKATAFEGGVIFMAAAITAAIEAALASVQAPNSRDDFPSDGGLRIAGTLATALDPRGSPRDGGKDLDVGVFDGDRHLVRVGTILGRCDRDATWKAFLQLISIRIAVLAILLDVDSIALERRDPCTDQVHLARLCSISVAAGPNDLQVQCLGYPEHSDLGMVTEWAITRQGATAGTFGLGRYDVIPGILVITIDCVAAGLSSSDDENSKC